MFDLRLVQRYVLGRVFALGWTAERFEAFDQHLRGSGRDAGKPERIGKKYQWIAYHEMLAFMADHYQYKPDRGLEHFVASAYQGSWQDNVRDIDPSDVLLRTAQLGDDEADSSTFWAAAHTEEWQSHLKPADWAAVKSDIPLPLDLLICRDNPSGDEWVNLYMSMKWTIPKTADEDAVGDDGREIWLHADAALLRRSDVTRFKKKTKVGEHGVHGSGLHEIFLGEIGWSEASSFFDDPYYSHLGWAGELNSEEIPVIAATQGYLRERSGLDCSIESESISLRLPTPLLLTELDAAWSGTGASYVDKNGRVVAFDPSAQLPGPSALLVRKDRLLQILQTNDWVVCWIIQGEKTHASGDPDYHLQARRSFRGRFFWDGETITGRYTFDAVEVFDREDS